MNSPRSDRLFFGHEEWVPVRIPLQILGIGLIRYKCTKLPILHRSNFFHLLFILEGEGYVILNGRIHQVTKGDVHIYHPAWVHDIWPKEGAV